MHISYALIASETQNLSLTQRLTGQNPSWFRQRIPDTFPLSVQILTRPDHLVNRQVLNFAGYSRKSALLFKLSIGIIQCTSVFGRLPAGLKGGARP